MRTSLST
jgi:hypothetical protein